jgi:hypothetical protein
METQENQSKKKANLERIVGIIFIIPPILGVIFFILNVFISYVGDLPELDNLSSNWTGNYSRDGGGFTSAAPIYLGLMAIAGAMLLKESKK